jgi:hypothetical protein
MSTKIVRKIDNKDEFDKIKTGYKSTEGLSKNNKEHYTMFYNKFKTQFNLTTKSNILWLAEHHDFVFNYFKNHPTYKPLSKRSYYNTISNTLLAIDKDKYKDVAKTIFQHSRAIQERVEKIRDDQQLTESEKNNFVCEEDIVHTRDGLIAQWNNNKGDKKLHMKMLILALNTYIPPLRLDMLDMEYYDKDIEPPEDNINYLWKHNNRYMIVMNYDKIENKRKKAGLDREILDLSINNKFMNGKMCSELLDMSFDILPRKYVLIAVTRNNKPLSQGSYDSYLKTMFKKNVRQNILRKAYVNKYHADKAKLSLNEKKLLAKYMRHSYTIAQQSYRKLEVAELCKDTVIKPIKIKKKQQSIKKMFKKMAIIDEIEEVKTDGIEEVKAVEKEPFDIKKWNKKYQDEHRDKYKQNSKDYYEKNKDDKNRKKIIRYINGAEDRIPTNQSIDKYDLKFENGKWI